MWQINSYTELYKNFKRDNDKNSEKACAVIDLLYGTEKFNNEDYVKHLKSILSPRKPEVAEQCIERLRKGLSDSPLYNVFVKLDTSDMEEIVHAGNGHTTYIPVFYNNKEWGIDIVKEKIDLLNLIQVFQTSNVFGEGGDNFLAYVDICSKFNKLDARVTSKFNPEVLDRNIHGEAGVLEWLQDNIYGKDSGDILGNFSQRVDLRSAINDSHMKKKAIIYKLASLNFIICTDNNNGMGTTAEIILGVQIENELY